MRSYTHPLVKCLLVLLGLALSMQLTSQPASQAATPPRGRQKKEIKPLKGEALRFLVSQLRARNKGLTAP